MMKKYLQYSGITGLALLVIGFVIYSINSVVTTIAAIFMIVGVALLVLYTVLNFSQIKQGLSSRSAKFGSNAALTIIFVLGILIVLNIVFNRFSLRADTTAAKQFSLAEQTRKVLKNLDQDVKVTGFFKSGDEFQLNELLTEYSHYSPRFSFRFIDPDKKPGEAKRYDIKAYNTVVVESGGKEEKITKSTEEDITNAMIKVTREGVKKVYFTTGHGERDYDGSDRFGFSALKKALEDENYQTDKILLAQQDSIPSDCSVLVIAGPKSDLFEKEENMLNDYLKTGGTVLFMLDPDAPDSYVNLLSQWGIKVDKDIVVDASGIGQLFGAGPTIPIVSQYKDHTITKDFRVMTVFPEARSISAEKNPPSGVTVTELATTSPRSWGETGSLTSGRVSLDDQDIRGPVSILTVAQKDAEKAKKREDKYGLGTGNAKTRLAVFGDSDFATNGSINLQGNSDLVLNTISWLAEEEDLISVRPKDPEDRRLNLTARQSKIMLYFGVILLPVVIFGAGIAVYRKRK
jgi:ABC-type uncharacterized transport system involved in gliding motility auxiliary subunit